MIEGVSYSQRFFEDVIEDEELPSIKDVITYRRVIMNPGATWDYFPGHYDPEYARSQGQPTIYVNTMHILGFVDRLITQWAGPSTFLMRRKVSVHLSVYAGDTMMGRGRVVDKRVEERSGHRHYLIDLEALVENQHSQRCASANLTIALPSRTAAYSSEFWR